MQNQNLIVGCAITAVVFGATGFWGGKIYNSNRFEDTFEGRGIYNQSGRGMMNNRDDQNRNNNKISGNSMNRGGGMIIGEVSSIDGDSLTVKLADGSSKIVVLSKTTSYTISNESSREKLIVGTKVAVMGETTTDGSTTASSVELNPALRGQAVNSVK